MFLGGQIFVSSSLEDFSNGNFKNLNEKFDFKGTPYFITNFDGKIWITEIVEHQGIYSFDSDECGNLINKEALFSFDGLSDSDIQRKIINPVLR